jgi:hypothetical protein
MTEDEAIALVMKFLRATEARDLQVSEAMMAPGSKITFPGNKVFASQTEMVKASISRYHWVKKTFELAESFIKGEDCLVYVMGTLYGENRHGVSFSDIRYIDRFVIRDSLITQQDVWNDLSESGVLDRTAD